MGARVRDPSPIADDGDAFRFCSTPALLSLVPRPWLRQDETRRASHAGGACRAVRRRRPHLSRGRSRSSHRRRADRHGRRLMSPTARGASGSWGFSCRAGDRAQRDFSSAVSLQRGRARFGDAVPVLVPEHRGAGDSRAGFAAAPVPAAERGHRHGGAARRQVSPPTNAWRRSSCRCRAVMPRAASPRRVSGSR